MNDSDDLLAMRYAFGVADFTEIASVEQRMPGDKALASRVGDYEQIFAGLERPGAGVTPPPSVWDRIDQAIDDLEQSPQTRTMRATSLSWEDFLPGVERKILFADTASAISGVLYRVAPGTVVPSHGHAVIEECLVLEGEIEIDGVTIRAGDLHMAFAGTRHSPLSSPRGALVYIRGDLQFQP